MAFAVLTLFKNSGMVKVLADFLRIIVRTVNANVKTVMKPVVIHLPHSAQHIPDFIRNSMLVTDNELMQDMVAFTDWRTRDIFTHRAFPNRVVFPVSRMVCDPERYRSDKDESMSKVGLGAVYQNDAFLRPLRCLDALQRELILRLYYDPHHKALTKAVETQITRHGHCIIVDAHSFSSVPLPYEPDQSDDRPDICIGTCREHTPRLLERRAVTFFQSKGLSVSVNSPYAGTMVPLKFWRDPSVQSIMVEINRGLYRKMEALKPSSGYATIKNAIGEFLSVCAL